MENETLIAIPPGATIKEQLGYRGMTAKELANKMGMTAKQMDELLRGEACLTTETAYKLETALGVPATFWLNLEAGYRKKLDKMKNRGNIL